MAIFTGQSGGNIPTCYTYSFLGTSLTYKFNTCCITDFPNEELLASSNPFALVVLVAKTALLSGKVSEEFLMDQYLLISRQLHRKNIFSKKKIAAVLTFLKNYIIFEGPQINRIFNEQVDQINGKTNSMDIFEQVAEMRAEEARTEERENFTKKLLAETELSPEKIASLAGVSLSLVEKIKESLQPK